MIAWNGIQENRKENGIEMSKFFNLDSPLMQFLTKLSDLMILNIVFLITCLPVFTIGAAWTALYYVTLKMVRDEYSNIIRSYLKAFRQNFVQATILWLGVLAVGAVLVLDYLILDRVDSTYSTVMNIGIGILAAFCFMVLQYLFPLLSKFDASTIQTLKNACLLSVAHLPRTLVMVFSAVGILLITFFNGYTASIGMLLWMLFGFALMAYSNSMILVKVFDKLISASAE